MNRNSISLDVFVLLLDAANDYSDNMSEQVDIIEVKTECDELVSHCRNTNIVDNHSIQDEVTYESKIYISVHFKISFQ